MQLLDSGYCHEEKNPYVMADELRIREVLLNIIPGTVFLIVLPFLQKYN